MSKGFVRVNSLLPYRKPKHVTSEGFWIEVLYLTVSVTIRSPYGLQRHKQWRYIARSQGFGRQDQSKKIGFKFKAKADGLGGKAKTKAKVNGSKTFCKCFILHDVTTILRRDWHIRRVIGWKRQFSSRTLI